MKTYTIFRGEDVEPHELSFVLDMLTQSTLDPPTDAITFVFGTVFSKKNGKGGRVIVIADDETEKMTFVNLDEVDKISVGKSKIGMVH